MRHVAKLRGMASGNGELMTLEGLRRFLATADYPGPSRSTIARWLQRGELPRPLNVPGAKLVWRRQDLEDWLATR